MSSLPQVMKEPGGRTFDGALHDQVDGDDDDDGGRDVVVDENDDHQL